VLRALARRTPMLAHRRRGGLSENVPVSEILVGDEIAIFPHEICPVDGEVVQGRSTMDESYLTGEPFLIAKGPGALVLSGVSPFWPRPARWCGRYRWSSTPAASARIWPPCRTRAPRISPA